MTTQALDNTGAPPAYPTIPEPDHTIQTDPAIFNKSSTKVPSTVEKAKQFVKDNCDVIFFGLTSAFAAIYSPASFAVGAVVGVIGAFVIPGRASKISTFMKDRVFSYIKNEDIKSAANDMADKISEFLKKYFGEGSAEGMKTHQVFGAVGAFYGVSVFGGFAGLQFGIALANKAQKLVEHRTTHVAVSTQK